MTNEEMAVRVADQIVPEYRNGKRQYPCHGTVAKRWQAAYDASIASWQLHCQCLWADMQTHIEDTQNRSKRLDAEIENAMRDIRSPRHRFRL